MVPDSPAADDDSPSLVHHVIRSALTAASLTTDPAAGRLLARLVVATLVETDGNTIGGYLSPVPGEPSYFEVRAFRAGNLVPSTVTTDLDIVTALKLARRLSSEYIEGLEIIARQPSSSVERCVFARDSTGELEYRAASRETLLGDPAACDEALQVWASTLAHWKQELIDAAASDPAPAEVVAAAATHAPPAETSEPVDQAGIVGALDRFFSNLTVELDLDQFQDVVARAVTQDRGQAVDDLARRLDGMLQELKVRIADASVPPTAPPPAPAPRPAPQPIVVGVPTSAEVAEVVSAQIAALLSETVLRRDHGETRDEVQLLRRVATSIHQIEAQLDGVRDELRRSNSQLTALADHQAVAARHAAASDRLTEAAIHEMQRLANRIDDQVSALAATAGGGSELSDGVARVTRKLRQSVAELDRALERLDQVTDQAGGFPPRRTTNPRAMRPGESRPPALPARSRESSGLVPLGSTPDRSIDRPTPPVAEPTPPPGVGRAGRSGPAVRR